jgi:quinol monooxygenase YgiN
VWVAARKCADLCDQSFREELLGCVRQDDGENPMGLHRTVLEWTTDDYNTVVALARRMSDYIEANEPDTLAFEWFGDEASGKVVWYQVYTNDEAFLKHAQNMAEIGLRDELQKVLSFERLMILTPITHSQVKEMAHQMDAVELKEIAGIVR